MSIERLVDQLSRDLKPVHPRSVAADALILAIIGGIELALFIGLGAMRPDMPMAMEHLPFWWKLTGLGLVATVGAGVAILSLNPVASPRRGLRSLVAIAAVCLAAGWGIDAAGHGWPALAERLNWRDGLQCVAKMVLLSLPAVIGIGFLMRRGAPTDLGGTALAAGIASAAWGAFVFVFACPYDDLLYTAIWYSVGCGLVTLLARLILPGLSRW